MRAYIDDQHRLVVAADNALEDLALDRLAQLRAAGEDPGALLLTGEDARPKDPVAIGPVLPGCPCLSCRAARAAGAGGSGG